MWEWLLCVLMTAFVSAAWALMLSGSITVWLSKRSALVQKQYPNAVHYGHHELLVVAVGRSYLIHDARFVRKPAVAGAAFNIPIMKWRWHYRCPDHAAALGLGWAEALDSLFPDGNRYLKSLSG